MSVMSARSATPSESGAMMTTWPCGGRGVISGPATLCISSGSTSPIAAPTRSATGSTSCCHAGRVASTHSARLHATAV